jgi:hypothetical protein
MRANCEITISILLSSYSIICEPNHEEYIPPVMGNRDYMDGHFLVFRFLCMLKHFNPVQLRR